MESFRKTIIRQIDNFPQGRIFRFGDLTFNAGRRAHVAVILSDMVKKKKLVRLQKGIYLVPQPSLLSLQYKPLDYDYKLQFISDSLKGYITGTYVFNLMRLTEQVPTVITVATPRPVREFEKLNIRCKCIKASVRNPAAFNLYHLRLLDAIKYIHKIPGQTAGGVYGRLMNFHLKKMSEESFSELCTTALHYPPRVRKILADCARDLNNIRHYESLMMTLNSNTRFVNCY